MNDHLSLTLISSRPTTKRERADNDRMEKAMRDGCQERLQRYRAASSDAPAPVPEYERCG